LCRRRRAEPRRSADSYGLAFCRPGCRTAEGGHVRRCEAGTSVCGCRSRGRSATRVGAFGGVADQTSLVVVSCVSRPEAERALAALRTSEVRILDAAVVTQLKGGRVELHQTNQVAAGEGVVAGGAVGFVAGMLLGGPIGGALLGMLGGGIWGARDTGVPDARLRELGESLAPGGALLCVLVEADAAAAARSELAPYGEVADADAPAVP
jgi:uncharacterized membrane protein